MRLKASYDGICPFPGTREAETRGWREDGAGPYSESEASLGFIANPRLMTKPIKGFEV